MADVSRTNRRRAAAAELHDQRWRIELWADQLVESSAAGGWQRAAGFRAAIKSCLGSLSAPQLHAMAAALWDLTLEIGLHDGFAGVPPSGCGLCVACVKNRRTSEGPNGQKFISWTTCESCASWSCKGPWAFETTILGVERWRCQACKMSHNRPKAGPPSPDPEDGLRTPVEADTLPLVGRIDLAAERERGAA